MFFPHIRSGKAPFTPRPLKRPQIHQEFPYHHIQRHLPFTRFYTAASPPFLKHGPLEVAQPWLSSHHRWVKLARCPMYPIRGPRALGSASAPDVRVTTTEPPPLPLFLIPAGAGWWFSARDRETPPRPAPSVLRPSLGVRPHSGGHTAQQSGSGSHAPHSLALS